jgi:hypothetical protein
MGGEEEFLRLPFYWASFDPSMTMNEAKKILILTVSWLLLTSLLSACSSESTERLWLEAPGWSRAQLLGISQINDPVPVVTDQMGNIYTIIIVDEDEFGLPIIIAMDSAGKIVWEKALDVQIDRPDKPALVWDGDLLHLFWLDGGALYSLSLDDSGELVSVPKKISGEINVDRYDVASDGNGALAIWFAGPRREPGLYIIDLGDVESSPQLIDPQGIWPSITYDQNGNLHASWAHHPQGFGESILWYAMYPDGIHEQGKEILVAKPVLAPTSILRGPILGLDTEDAYIYWSQEIRTGLDAGSTNTTYITFPHGKPEQNSVPRRVLVPVDPDLEYEEADDRALLAGPRVDLVNGNVGRSSALRDISTNPNMADELVLSFESTLPHLWRKEAQQINTLFTNDGDITDYQLLSFTRAGSTSPTIISNSDGYLYASWVEPAEEGFKVYLAGTAPEMVDTFSPITFNDATRVTAETTFGILAGVVISPLAALLWMIIPLGALLVTGIFRKGNDSLSNPVTVFSIILSIVLYEVIRIGSLPFIRTYVPFSAWIPLPDWLQSPLQYAVPIVITIIALWFAWFLTYRRGNESPFYLVVLFIAADAVMTMAVYGIVVLGAI